MASSVTHHLSDHHHTCLPTWILPGFPIVDQPTRPIVLSPAIHPLSGASPSGLQGLGRDTSFHHMTPASPIWHQLPLYGITFHHVGPNGTKPHHMSNIAQGRRWKRYVRKHISDFTIPFPRMKSSLWTHYKASHLAGLCGILQAHLFSSHTSSLIHLFTC